ncbi:MAG TPA: cytochrome c oxidase assembly protein [Anaerolineae bacterium]
MARHKITFSLLAIAIAFMGLLAARQWQVITRPPDDTALAYAQAVYARDYAAAWTFISAEDKAVKSRTAYLAENTSFAGLEQELAYTLANWIQFTETEVQINGNQATVTAQMKAPNGNQTEVYEILQSARLESELMQTEVRALPGETLTAVYRATNHSDHTTTGKAEHFILPEEHETYFNSIQCFCFIQQTLDPGESIDMKLIFRIDYDVPAAVRELENKYMFYSLESFPQGNHHDE